MDRRLLNLDSMYSLHGLCLLPWIFTCFHVSSPVFLIFHPFYITLFQPMFCDRWNLTNACPPPSKVRCTWRIGEVSRQRIGDSIASPNDDWGFPGFPGSGWVNVHNLFIFYVLGTEKLMFGQGPNYEIREWSWKTYAMTMIRLCFGMNLCCWDCWAIQSL